MCRPVLLGLLAIILATVAILITHATPNSDRQQEIGLALDQYAAARTADQRSAVIDYLQHFDRKLVAGAVVDHIIASRTGIEATAYNGLVEALNPDGCLAVLDRLGKTDVSAAKGKLIVAMRHCQNMDCIQALEHCLDDKRAVLFEARGPRPRRVCDLAYDELYLKLRSDTRFGLDSSPRMKDVISEKTPIKSRDVLIAKLKAKLTGITPTASPSPSATPEQGKPATADIS